MSGLSFGHMFKKFSNPSAVILCIPEKSRNFKQGNKPTEAIALQNTWNNTQLFITFNGSYLSPLSVIKWQPDNLKQQSFGFSLNEFWNSLFIQVQLLVSERHLFSGADLIEEVTVCFTYGLKAFANLSRVKSLIQLQPDKLRYSSFEAEWFFIKLLINITNNY